MTTTTTTTTTMTIMTTLTICALMCAPASPLSHSLMLRRVRLSVRSPPLLLLLPQAAPPIPPLIFRPVVASSQRQIERHDQRVVDLQHSQN
jgi:hypothetical protein